MDHLHVSTVFEFVALNKLHIRIVAVADRLEFHTPTADFVAFEPFESDSDLVGFANFLGRTYKLPVTIDPALDPTLDRYPLEYPEFLPVHILLELAGHYSIPLTFFATDSGLAIHSPAGTVIEPADSTFEHADLVAESEYLETEYNTYYR